MTQVAWPDCQLVTSHYHGSLIHISPPQQSVVFKPDIAAIPWDIKLLSSGDVGVTEVHFKVGYRPVDWVQGVMYCDVGHQCSADNVVHYLVPVVLYHGKLARPQGLVLVPRDDVSSVLFSPHCLHPLHLPGRASHLHLKSKLRREYWVDNSLWIIVYIMCE